MIIMPDTPIEGAKVIAAKTIRALEDAQIPHEFSATCGHVTASLGVTSSRFGASNIEALIEQADQSLYAAKERGRNRFISYSDIL